MRKLYIHVVPESRKGRPSLCAMSIGGRVSITELYRSGEGKPLKLISDRIKSITDIINKAISRNFAIICSSSEQLLHAFDIDIDGYDNIYDMHIGEQSSSDDKQQDINNAISVVESMTNLELASYNKLLAMVAPTYHSMSKTGIVVNYSTVYPRYSTSTYSGRSKTTNYNIQGLDAGYLVWPVGTSEYDLLIHFDWMSADLRIASLLSGDDRLSNSFIESDPYTVYANELSYIHGDTVSRDDAKIALLRAINSIDVMGDDMREVYPNLWSWLADAMATMTSGSQELHSILGRKFTIAGDRSMKSVINGVLQGSVAHAMHNTVRRVHNTVFNRLLAEIHDSIVVAANRHNVKETIDSVVEIMLHPFESILDDNPVFPVKVSIGKRWKEWKFYRMFR